MKSSASRSEAARLAAARKRLQYERDLRAAQRQLEQMNRMLKGLTITDSLTGLKNRSAIISRKSTNGRSVSVTLGVASVVAASNIGECELVERAGAALYRAKRAGRNCVLTAA